MHSTIRQFAGLFAVFVDQSLTQLFDCDDGCREITPCPVQNEGFVIDDEPSRLRSKTDGPTGKGNALPPSV
jgi:hypothetical protein